MIKTSFYSGIGTVISFISGFVVQKVVAIFAGPSGVAIIGQFTNFITISTSLANGGIQDGLVKYTAEFRNDNDKLTDIFSTSLRITLFLSVLVSVLLISFSGKLSVILLNTNEYKYVIILFGFSVLLFGLNRMLISILNGIGEIKKYVLSNISTSLFGLIVTASATYLYGIAGALVAISFSQFVVFFITLAFVIKSNWFRKSLFMNKISRQTSRKLLAFSLMSLTSLILPPLVQVGIRNFIIGHNGLNDAGMWDAMMKISNAYLGIITTTLSVYYLPKLSSLTLRHEIRTEILNGFKILIPLLILIGTTLYILREFVVLTLYTPEFLQIKAYFLPQFIGDIFKIASWLLAFLMLAKAKTKLFISTQVIFSCITYFLSIFFVTQFGLVGVFWAGVIKYFIYLVVMIIIFRKYLIK